MLYNYNTKLMEDKKMNDYEDRSFADTISGIIDSILDALVIVQLVYLILKLENVIHYTWWQVATPSFIYIGIIVIMVLIVGVLTLLSERD